MNELYRRFFINHSVYIELLIIIINYYYYLLLLLLIIS